MMAFSEDEQQTGKPKIRNRDKEDGPCCLKLFFSGRGNTDRHWKGNTKCGVTVSSGYDLAAILLVY